MHIIRGERHIRSPRTGYSCQEAALLRTTGQVSASRVDQVQGWVFDPPQTSSCKCTPQLKAGNPVQRLVRHKYVPMSFLVHATDHQNQNNRLDAFWPASMSILNAAIVIPDARKVRGVGQPSLCRTGLLILI